MALTDPFAAYNAANNVEAHLLRNMLVDRGIEAHVTEDNSPAGIFALGVLNEIHRPQVWIERTDRERAKPVLDEFEKSMGHHRDDPTNVIELPVAMTCESCGQEVTFPAEERGTVQECPHCSAYLDVGGEDGEWEEVVDEEMEKEEDEEQISE